ncbi:MAG: hypothetical protein ABI612_03265 [Betaproteobacteria bacterium]
MAETPAKSPTADLPPAAQKYVRYVIAFGVSLAVGLAPLLGKLRIPGFSSLLALYPVNLADTIIPFAALLMALPAIAVQFYAGDRIARAVLHRWFVRTTLLTGVLLFSVLAAYLFFVVQVPFDGGKGQAAYAIGLHQQPDSVCLEHKKSLSRCIAEELTFNPAQVEAVFPENEIRLVKLLLSMGYLALMGCFGTLIGLLVLREGARRSIV